MNKASALVLFLLIGSANAFSQSVDKRFSYTTHHHTYNNGIALNLGEYSGVGYKHYFARKYVQSVTGERIDKRYRFTTAFQANINFFALKEPLQKDYFEQSFQQYIFAKAVSKGHEPQNINGFEVEDARLRNGVIVQAHYLIGADIKQSGLQVYTGGGLQIRSTSISYESSNGDNGLDVTVRQTNPGFNIVLGLEYMIPFRPLSFTLEYQAFLENQYGFGYYWPQLNARIRYNFIRKPDEKYCGNCPK